MKAYVLSEVEVVKKFVSYPGAAVREPRDFFVVCVTQNVSLLAEVVNFFR